MATGQEQISFTLPDGRSVQGTIQQRHKTADGSPAGVSGRIDTPAKGTFHFRLQPAGFPTGPVIGAVVIEGEEIAFRVQPGPDETSLLTEMPVDQVICRNYALPPVLADGPQEIPADHPTDIPTPSYQNGIIPLQSRPGAIGVIYLDFDGQPGPQEGWGNFDAAAPTGMTTTLIKSIWTRVSEDYAPFKLNVTTDLQVFLTAPETARQRCIITPTSTAHPSAGGVAFMGSFGWSGDTPCWCFYYSNSKYATEIISHEIGHTLGLCHDGRTPAEDYYLGHGTDPVGWAPIMGAGYYKNLSQWSKGEYALANQFQDDVAVIAANPGVDYALDDAGDTHATAATLEVFENGEIHSQGNIETQSDVDAFRFTTTGGPVSLTISPVAAGQNLDVQAGIYDSAGNPLISNNPDLALNATLSITLAAGSYSVRVDGVGRGNSQSDGYTDYGSLGQYTITGTIGGAISPDRFQIAENSTLGTVIGTPVPRNDHAGLPLTYQIVSGNTGAALAIDPDTGVITVANPAILDFETLSTGWDVPSLFDLTVSILDFNNPALDESLRVVVTVLDVNEAPQVWSEAPLIAISHTLAGVSLGQISTSDPDRYDFVNIEIISGDPASRFALSPSGEIFVVGELDASENSSYQLTFRATDHGSPAISTDQTITVTVVPASTEYAPGYIYHTIYENIPGMALTDLTEDTTFPTRPTREVRISGFSDDTQGDAYGSTVRSWLIAPITGTYRFWITGDDSAELFLSLDGVPSNMTKICGLDSSSSRNQWTLYESQQSVAYSLTAGQVYYLEARHKQDTADNHLAVAWEIKDSPDTETLVPLQVIPGRYLSPHYLNYSPKVYASDVNLYRNSYSGYHVTTAFATEPNVTDSLTWSITGGNEAGVFGIDPDTGEVTVIDSSALSGIATSSVPLTLTATDSGSDPLSDSAQMTINLLDPLATPASGLILEFWDEIPGNTLLPLYTSPDYPDTPDRTEDLDSMDYGPVDDSDFGSRIRAYITPPSTGSYTFYISCDDAGSLLLSNDANPENAIQIASAASATGYQDWEASPSQKSFPVPLAAGQRYFIEARMKQASGSSHLSVGWSGPGITDISVIGNENSEPYDSNVAPLFSLPAYSFNLEPGYTLGTVAGNVTASDASFEEIRYAIISGDPLHAFNIHPVTGTISIQNPANLEIGSTYQLQIGAQDSGHGRHFAPRETLVPVSIVLPNEPPEFTANPIELGTFPAGQPVSLSLAPYVADPEDPLVFSMNSSPAWLSISPSGQLSGTPSYNDLGPELLTVSVDDGHGHIVLGDAILTVTAPLDIPASVLTVGDASVSVTAGTLAPETSENSSISDNFYLELSESLSDNTSALEYEWTFPIPPDSQATFSIEAHHSINTEGDDFQFSVSTDDGATFTDAILVTSTADDDTPQDYSFITGSSSSVIIKVTDTDRTSGNTSLDTLSMDLLQVTLAANNRPVTTDATFQIASHAPVGVEIGSVAATDPDAGQNLSYSIPRGNEAGFFSITPTGILEISADIAPGSGPYSLIVVSTDDGHPALANYATVTINVVEPVAATISLENLSPIYSGAPQPVTVTTSPPGLLTILSYEGSPDAPSDAGNYVVTATIIDPLHVGSAIETLNIGKAPAEITLTGLTQTYDGTPKSVTVTTSPSGLDHTLTYDESSESPAYFGNYMVTVTVTDPNYAGTSIETFSITNHLTITTGQTLLATVTPVPYQSLTNDGTLIVSTAPLHIAENVTNNGILRLYGDAVLDITGTLTNTGVIDIINWNGALPPAMINSGTILDRSSHRILSTTTTSTQITLKFPAYEGHLYQLESTDDLSAAWSPSGPSFTVSGNPLNPPILQFSNPMNVPRHFYRIAVKPAP